MAVVACSSSASNSENKPDNVNGFFADAGTYEIVKNDGRSNVIKVNGAKTAWAVVMYPLAEYKDKLITIEFSGDVKRTGAAGNLHWQVNNAPDYPGVSYQENAAPGVWHHMKGRLIVTPTNNEPFLYLTNWENNAQKTVYYIDKPAVTIHEGEALNPDLSLAPLKSTYTNDFLIGNIVDSKYASGKYFDLLKHHYNIVTSTVTYPIQLAPSSKSGSYQWEGADQIINLMLSNGIPVHGHILVWHEASPAWITTGTRAEVISNLERHINETLTHFKGKINSWDVVNEAMRDGLSTSDTNGDWKKCMRDSRNQWTTNPWYNKLGADYVELAFRAARAADPNITLYYNDYGLEDINKAEAVCKMIRDINARYKAEGNTRNLIEGVGSQAHIYETKNFNINNVRASLEKLTGLGIEVAITELDLSTAPYERGNGKDTVMSEADERAQAVFYARLFKLYKEYSDRITRVTMWGMDDGASWISVGNPCLFDWKLNAKKAFHAASNPDAFLAEN